jgi:GT2 family glycosyltransferase
MSQPTCSVIIVGHDHASYLPACLDSLLSQQGPTFEVILVDNGSSDDTPLIAQSYQKRIHYIHLPVNLGFAEGNNVGAAISKGEFLVFLNPDTVPHPGWLGTLVRPLFQDSRIGLTTSRIMLSDQPCLVNTCGNDITWTGLAVCRGLQEPAEQWRQAGDVAAVSGAACAVRSSVFHELGGFDKTLFLYYEDTDLSLRARLAGYWIWYVPDSVLTHHYSFRFSPTKTYYQERNRWLALMKVLQPGTLFLLLPGLLLGEIMAWIYAGLHGPAHFRAKWQGWLWIWRHRNIIRAQRRHVQALRRVTDSEMLALWSPRLRFVGAVPRHTAHLLEWLMEPLLAGYGAFCRRLVVW